MDSKLEEFLLAGREVDSTSSLFSLYSKLLDCYGFDQLMYAITSDHKQFASDAELGIVNHDMANGWVEYYRENNYLEADKTTHLVRANPGIYSWGNIAKQGDLSSLQSKIFRDAKDANMHHGNSISMHGPAGVKGVVIASSSEASYAPSKHKLDIINMASYHFHLCFLSLVQHKTVDQITPLTNKEYEVLQWLSTGMTKQEIASKIKVSVHTIDYHSRSILNKMNAKNMTSALVTAIKRGLLSL